MIQIPPQLIQKIRIDLQRLRVHLFDPYPLSDDIIVCARRVDMIQPAETWLTHNIYPKEKRDVCVPIGILALPIRGRCDFNITINNCKQFADDMRLETFTNDEIQDLNIQAFSRFFPCVVNFKRRDDDPCEWDFLFVAQRIPS